MSSDIEIIRNSIESEKYFDGVKAMYEYLQKEDVGMVKAKNLVQRLEQEIKRENT